MCPPWIKGMTVKVQQQWKHCNRSMANGEVELCRHHCSVLRGHHRPSGHVLQKAWSPEDFEDELGKEELAQQGHLLCLLC